MAEGVPVSRFSSMIRHMAAFLLFSAVSLMGMIIAVPMLPWRGARIRLGNVMARPMSRGVLRIAGVRMVGDWHDIGATAPAIYITNHASNADPWMGMIVCPTGGCGVAKREILRIPFFGWAYRLAGHLLIDRANSAGAVASMRSLADLVHRHRLSVWIWPEGTQSRDGRLLPFKRGFVHLAVATGLPVVPVLFHDAHLCWPARSTRLIPGVVQVEVLDKVDTSSWRSETAHDHAQAMHELFVGHLRASQRPVESSTA